MTCEDNGLGHENEKIRGKRRAEMKMGYRRQDKDMNKADEAIV
jgi:hypothetical protein